ncbi:MAG TPA: hypothetical protein VGO62_05615 [Myxococcota bacterium]|jgi:hypothetical protein
MLLQASRARAIGACVDASVTVGSVIVPADNAVDVPVNATPIVPADLDAALFVDGNEIASHVSTIAIDDGGLTLARIVPDAPLPDGVTVAIQRDGSILSRFTTGAVRDDDAPTAPTLRAATQEESNSALVAEWCAPAVDIRVTGDDDSALFLAANDAVPSIDGDIALSGLSAGQDLVVAGKALASTHASVVAVDVAGNVSAPAQLAVTFPAANSFSPGGCGGGAPAILVAPLTILRVRRRRR